VKPEVVERAARHDVICAAMNVDELQASHGPRLPDAVTHDGRSGNFGSTILARGA
jgi:hypothetical protein